MARSSRPKPHGAGFCTDSPPGLQNRGSLRRRPSPVLPTRGPFHAPTSPTCSLAASLEFLEEKGCASLPTRRGLDLKALGHRGTHRGSMLSVARQDRNRSIPVSGERRVEQLDQQVHPRQNPEVDADRFEPIKGSFDHGGVR